MFLFIYVETTLDFGGEKFKYISCSYLSLRVTSLRVNQGDLNTSHVLIYQNLCGKYKSFRRFKYISCSYLSSQGNGTGFIRNKFKYISCSYLSK